MTDMHREALQALLGETPLVERSSGWRQPPFRLSAYYYGFEPTGVLAIDRILSAIACAGKAYHHTDQWDETCTPYEDFLRGLNPVEWIQNAANDAATAIRHLTEQNEQNEQRDSHE